MIDLGTEPTEARSGDSRRATPGSWIPPIAGSVLLGVFADLGERAPDPWASVPQLGLPWLVLAVAWGHAARRSVASSLAGIVGIMATLGVWTAYKAMAYGGNSVDHFLRYDSHRWLLLGVVVGSAAGLAGGWLHASDWRLPTAWGLVVATGFAEGGSLLFLMARDGGNHPAEPIAVAEIAIGAGLFVLALRRCAARALLPAVVVWTAVGFLGGLVVFANQV
jgi:hypothetical protein